MQLELTIVTPERRISLSNIRQVLFRSPEGEVGLLAGHAALISLVASGIVRAFSCAAVDDEPPRCFVVEAGLVRAADNQIVLLTPQVLCEDELNASAAADALNEANTLLATLDPFWDGETYHEQRQAAALYEAVLALDHELAHRPVLIRPS